MFDWAKPPTYYAQSTCTVFCFLSIFLALKRMQLYSLQETCTKTTKIAKFDCSAVFSAGVTCTIIMSAMFVVKVSCIRTCIKFRTSFLSVCDRGTKHTDG